MIYSMMMQYMYFNLTKLLIGAKPALTTTADLTQVVFWNLNFGLSIYLDVWIIHNKGMGLVQ